jgi:cytochrome c-type biogenesis protein CcmH
MFICIAGLLLLATPAAAIDTDKAFEDPALQARYEKIISEVRCLKCQNQTIKDSNAFLADDLRREIRRMLEEGKSDAEIFDFLVVRYGEFALYRPRMSGKTLVLWLAPVVFIGFGAFIALRVVRRRMSLPVDDAAESLEGRRPDRCWFLFALMLAVAAVFLLWPAYRLKTRLSATGAAIVVAAVVLAPFVYLQIGNPDARNSQNAAPEIEEMVSTLAARLEKNPQDLPGWKMLGRSYFTMGRLPEAIAAFERAIELESGRDAQTLADLGEAVLMSDQSSITGRAGQLFETALSLSPANPKALFYRTGGHQSGRALARSRSMGSIACDLATRKRRRHSAPAYRGAAR